MDTKVNPFLMKLKFQTDDVQQHNTEESVDISINEDFSHLVDTSLRNRDPQGNVTADLS